MRVLLSCRMEPPSRQAIVILVHIAGIAVQHPALADIFETEYDEFHEFTKELQRLINSHDVDTGLYVDWQGSKPEPRSKHSVDTLMACYEKESITGMQLRESLALCPVDALAQFITKHFGNYNPAVRRGRKPRITITNEEASGSVEGPDDRDTREC